MATTSKRDTLRPRNVQKSYKFACGAEAPPSNCLRECTKTTKTSRGKKALKLTNTESLFYTTTGARLPSGVWCSGCRDGGEVVICITCNTNSICCSCINFELKDGIDHIDFECPPCFLKKDQFAPYPWMFKSRGPGRENWPRIDVTPLAIISIHLQGMVDSTSLITYHHLAPWLQGNLVLVDLMFNFDDPQNDFESQLDTMLQDFEEGDYKEWTRFLVIITTHCDPCTGDLHIAPGNTGSAPAHELLQIIFPERFQNILKKNKKNKNILNLLACGALSTRPQSKEDLKKIASENLFSKILCFSQPNFQPS
ncbi:hypothetical protein BYT27DRAFT_7323634, partial [Phlegmacium glaucopus]